MIWDARSHWPCSALHSLQALPRPGSSRVPLNPIEANDMKFQNTRSVPDVVGDLFSQFTTLMRKEAQLARAEVSENIAVVGRGLGMIIGAAVLLIPALVILLQAGVAAITEKYGVASYWSSLIVGGVTLVVGIVTASIGSRRLTSENIMPKRTVHQLQQDALVAKQQVSSDHDLRRAA